MESIDSQINVRQSNVRQINGTQVDVAQVATVSAAVLQAAVEEGSGSALPSATSATGGLTSLELQGQNISGSAIPAPQAAAPGNSAVALQTSLDSASTQSSTDPSRASTGAPNLTATNIEPSAGLPPSILSIDPKPPALPQSSPAAQSAAKPSILAEISPSAHPPGNSALPRFAVEPRPTPPPSDAAPAATPPANSSASSSAIPLPSLTLGANLAGGGSSNLTSNPGNHFSAAHGVGGSPSSEGAAQTVTATSAAQDNSQSSTPDGSSSDVPPHKTTAVAAAPIATTPTSALPAASVSAPGPPPADPAMQSAIQSAMSATPPTAGTGRGTTGPATTPGSAHSSDSRGPSGSDLPLNLPASAELSVHSGTSPVQMAQMVNQAAQSEMRIGMSTAAFGNVEVRTVVHANDVGVLIGSEKGDLRSLLANELPGIATSLLQQNLRLSQVNFHQTGFAFSNQMSSGGDAQPRWFASRPMAATIRPAESFSADSSEPAPPFSSSRGSGLSILA